MASFCSVFSDEEKEMLSQFVKDSQEYQSQKILGYANPFYHNTDRILGRELLDKDALKRIRQYVV